MKKPLYVVGALIIIFVIIYFTYGFYLNLTLQEAYEAPNKVIGINIAKTDNTYKSGICNQVLNIYPWELPSHEPVRPDKYSSTKVSCTIQDREPFDFNYFRIWSDKKEIASAYQHPFFVVRKLFFNNSLSICLQGVSEPLSLTEEVYSTSWGFSIRGLEYKIVLDDSLKNRWKTIIDGFFESGVFPSTASLVLGTSCSYKDSDVIKVYPVTHKLGWW